MYPSAQLIIFFVRLELVFGSFTSAKELSSEVIMELGIALRIHSLKSWHLPSSRGTFSAQLSDSGYFFGVTTHNWWSVSSNVKIELWFSYSTNSFVKKSFMIESEG